MNLKINEYKFFSTCPQYIYLSVPENTARRIIPLRGFPRVEWAHGNP